MFFLIALVMLFIQPAISWAIDLGQYYDGEAKPREEVAWIWSEFATNFRGWVYVRSIDSQMFSAQNPDVFPEPGWDCVVELLPGKHMLSVFYAGMTAVSTSDLELQIDVKGGENYILKENTKSGEWHPTIETFSPKEKRVNKLIRKKLCAAGFEDGVISSWQVSGPKGPIVLVLSISENNRTREFITSTKAKVIQPKIIGIFKTFDHYPCYRPEFVGKKV